ncbi:hypothetical protein [Burkholderia mayonis]|uniref:hypothetical protein n=1 Tax=Burkholderia mayonis TaxID=1385591 RepID=UPI00131F06E5|nr:hypothetical protein [Burkholderia mayonis]
MSLIGIASQTSPPFPHFLLANLWTSWVRHAQLVDPATFSRTRQERGSAGAGHRTPVAADQMHIGEREPPRPADPVRRSCRRGRHFSTIFVVKLVDILSIQCSSH